MWKQYIQILIIVVKAKLRKQLRKKRIWLLIVVLLRAAYVIMNNYGLNPLKKSLAKDHIFLTGAAEGLGRLLAIKLSQLGCKLTLSDINMPELQKTLSLCADNLNVHAIECDVSSQASITEAASKATQRFGEVTVLINNAAVVSAVPLMQLTEAIINKTLQVNTTSHLLTIKEFLPGMISQKRGHVVAIASMAGLTGCNGIADYCASKFGAVAIDESLRMEL